VQASIFEQIELIGVFGLIGLFANWIAKRQHFFCLPKVIAPPHILGFIPAFIVYLFLFLVGPTVIITLLTWVYAPLKTLLENHPPIMYGTAQLLSIMLITSYVIIYSLYQEKGVIKAIWKTSSSSIWKDILMGIVIYLVAFPTVTCIDQIGDFFTTLIFGKIEAEQVAVRFVRLSEDSVFMMSVAIFSTLIAAPILEEWIFRGYLQTYLKKKLGRGRAIFFSSLVFALFHLSPEQKIANFTLVLSLFSLALYLGFLYEKRQSLAASIALHMTFNSISVMRILLF